LAPGQAFAPAKALTSLPGIRFMRGKSRISYVHFACARHEVVIANGCLSESLLLGPMAMSGLSGAERRVLRDVFPACAARDGHLNGPPARPCLTFGAVARRIRHHAVQLKLRRAGAGGEGTGEPGRADKTHAGRRQGRSKRVA
jgi:hypothetical protein